MRAKRQYSEDTVRLSKSHHCEKIMTPVRNSLRGSTPES